MGESALLVSVENRISRGINEQVHALQLRVKEASVPGITDLVPAYASLLITFNAQVMSHHELTEALDELLADPVEPDKQVTALPKYHVIPVQYGGETGVDLDEVARLHGFTESEVVRLHSKRLYRVYFLGFLPGFAYLGKLPPSLATPRLPTPRTRVSAGSVAIAGAQTAVYPFVSPGGWRIIGKTSLSVWDPLADTPARFAPGDSVQFAPSAYEPGVQDVQPMSTTPRTPAFEVVAAPSLTTVQDLGRPGLAHLGVSRGGAFDPISAVRANALVGNPPQSAVLEMTWNGPTLRLLRNATIAQDGADLECRVDGALIPTGLSWFVRRGAILRFSRTHPGRGGVRGYLAVNGGLDVPVLLASRSTTLQAHFGGHDGRPLQVGDLLGVCTESGDPGLIAGKYWLGKTTPIPSGSATLRFVPYRGRGEALASARRALSEQSFVLTEQADRMGFRFRSEEGSSLPVRRGELISFGVVRGVIQLPPDGNPVVLNVDHQTTGGYPLLGVVIQADWPVLAQLAPGATVRFEEVTLQEARSVQARVINDLAQGLQLLGRPLSPFLV